MTFLLLFGAGFRAADLLPATDTSSRSWSVYRTDGGETVTKSPAVHTWQREEKHWHRMDVGQQSLRQTRGTLDRKGLWLEAVSDHEGWHAVDRALLLPARFDAGDAWESTYFGHTMRFTAERWDGCPGGVSIRALEDRVGQIDRYCPGIGIVESVSHVTPAVTITQQREVFDASGTRVWPPPATDRPIDPKLAGRYALRAFEMAGMLELRADGTGFIAMSFGSADPKAALRWWREGDRVVLESSESPGLPELPRVVSDAPWSRAAERARTGAEQVGPPATWRPGLALALRRGSRPSGDPVVLVYADRQEEVAPRNARGILLLDAKDRPSAVRVRGTEVPLAGHAGPLVVIEVGWLPRPAPIPHSIAIQPDGSLAGFDRVEP